MSIQNPEILTAPEQLSPVISRGHSLQLTAPLETRMDQGFALQTVVNSGESVTDSPRSENLKFAVPAKVAELTGLSLSTVKRNCHRGKYTGAQKTLIDGTESWQIPVASLPPHAQAALLAEFKAAVVSRAAAVVPILAAPSRELATIETRAMWDAYERSGGVCKSKAEKAFAAVLMFNDLVSHGHSKGEAEKAVLAAHGASKPTLHRYRNATDGHHQSEWLPRLSPKYKGGRPLAELTEAAWDEIIANYLSQSKPPFAVVMENARIEARQTGWVIPSNDAVWNRIKKLPAWMSIQGRQGPKALERSQPSAKRSYVSLALHELWESDGRKSDIWCLWPDGTIARPFLIVWRDVRSRVILGVKGCFNPSTEIALSALFMAMERTKTAPDFAKLDNGREYASKAMTGGQKTRYRWTFKPGEQIGVLTHLGVKVEWSEPGRGQDKPIESWWNYCANRIDKAFEGAYCGKNVVSKPENFDRKKAIPIAVFQAKVNEVFERFNTEHRHSGDGMNGKTPMEVYAELAMQTTRRAVDPAHLRMCKQGATQITPGAGNVYTLKIPGYGECRYHSPEIANASSVILSRKHNVYYHLESPQSPVSVYDGDVFLGDAQWQETLPFRSAGLAAGEHKKRNHETMKPQKALVKQIKARPNQNLQIAPAFTGLAALPPIGLFFDGKREAPALPAVVVEDDPWEKTGRPGERRHRVTGQISMSKMRAAIDGAAP